MGRRLGEECLECPRNVASRRDNLDGVARYALSFLRHHSAYREEGQITMRLSLGRVLFVSSLLGVGLILPGCPTIKAPKDFGSGWVGAPIERMLLAVDRDHNRDPKNEPSREDLIKTRYKMSNGNDVYVIPIVFNRCKVHWEVNPAGIIVDYRYEEVVKGGCNW